MKIKSFISIGLVAAVTSLSQPVLAGSSSNNDDFAPSQTACMVVLNDASRTRIINVGYIRLVQVENENPNLLHISMASNYYNASTDQLKIKYATNEDATRALLELSDKINDCQYTAAQKRNKRM